MALGKRRGRRAKDVLRCSHPDCRPPYHEAHLCLAVSAGGALARALHRRRTKGESGKFFFGMTAKACLVSFVGPSGVCHSVEVTAGSLYEAATLGLSALRKAEWS